MNIKRVPCLAVITAVYLSRNDIGKPVTVLRALGSSETVTSRCGELFVPVNARAAWLCEAAGADFPRAIADACLRPIDDPGEPVTEREQLEVNA